MASADFLQFVVTMLRFGRAYSFTPARPPRVSSITFASSVCRIYASEFVQYWTSFCLGNSSVPNTPCMRFLFVRPRFCPWVSILPTSDFLRIPPHDGHPCLRLTVPTAKPVADSHRQVIAHAERTIVNGRRLPGGRFSIRFYSPSMMASPRIPAITRAMKTYCFHVSFSFRKIRHRMRDTTHTEEIRGAATAPLPRMAYT